MARVLIIGASKGIGLETTRQALEAGHMVRAFARSAGEMRYRVLKERSQWRNGTIARADVADFLVQQIEDRACVGKKPVLVY